MIKTDLTKCILKYDLMLVLKIISIYAILTCFIKLGGGWVIYNLSLWLNTYKISTSKYVSDLKTLNQKINILQCL